KQIPASLQAEMVDGPLGHLHLSFTAALQASKPALADAARQHVITDLEHLLEGVEHPARERALNLLHQLDAEYQQMLLGKGDAANAERLRKALLATDIEGM